MPGVLEISHLSLPLGLTGSSPRSLAHSGSQKGFAELSGESPTQRGEFKLEESGRGCGLAKPSYGLIRRSKLFANTATPHHCSLLRQN